MIILNEAYENGDTDAFVDDLVPDATPVLESTQELVQAATRLLDCSEDEVIGYYSRICPNHSLHNIYNI